MKTDSKPIRTTIVFGLLCALVLMLYTFIFGYGVFPSIPPYLAMGLFVALYSLLMARWAGVGLAAVCFPVLVIVSGFFLTRSPGAFMVLTCMVLSWIRSGICFKGAVFRRLFAEILLCGGAGVLLLLYLYRGSASYPLGIWMFFLIQALYFVFVADMGGLNPAETTDDPFDRARNEAERILSGG